MNLELVSEPHGEGPDPSVEFAAFFAPVIVDGQVLTCAI